MTCSIQITILGMQLWHAGGKLKRTSVTVKGTMLLSIDKRWKYTQLIRNCTTEHLKEMSQRVFLGTTVASGIDDLIAKTADQLQCTVQNSVRDLVQINDCPVQSNNTKLVPRL